MVAMIQGQEMLIPRLLAMVTAVASMMMLLMVAVNFPARFALEDGRFSSLGEGLHWDVADYADKPLELLGSVLQEDICIMHEQLVGGLPNSHFLKSLDEIFLYRGCL
eukprot:s118_g17.t1